MQGNDYTQTWILSSENVYQVWIYLPF